MRCATAPGTCASCGSSTKIHTGAPQLLNPCYCLSDESDRDEGNSVRMMKAKKVNWGGATTTNAGGKVTSVNPGLAAESSENSNTSSLPLTVGPRASSSPQLASGIPSIANPNSRSPFRQPYFSTSDTPNSAAIPACAPGRVCPSRPRRKTTEDRLLSICRRGLHEFLLHVKHPECRLRVDLCSGQMLLAHAIAGQLKIGLATKLVAEVSSEL
ncbi:hypothetical protein pipiens_016897 [Culex pipiens pipiens]|uniref:Uncharacterized protein n=1 Tax=Culex pipiens pipiens TaxID=38569 RepID=A0ABD1CJ58_CULPP